VARKDAVRGLLILSSLALLAAGIYQMLRSHAAVRASALQASVESDHPSNPLAIRPSSVTAKTRASAAGAAGGGDAALPASPARFQRQAGCVGVPWGADRAHPLRAAAADARPAAHHGVAFDLRARLPRLGPGAMAVDGGLGAVIAVSAGG